MTICNRNARTSGLNAAAVGPVVVGTGAEQER